MYARISHVYLGIAQRIDVIQGNQINTSSLDNKFIVPYQRNAHFTGRRTLLEDLRAKLCEIAPKKWNHRVALYGLGGVGKTQLALEYVYMHQANYERIYWISAATEAKLLSEFEKIASQTSCSLKNSNLNSSDLAKEVLKWLNEQDNWLVVIDNLDDINVVRGLLPNSSPERHTLITTRNPNAEHIPAEGLQVSVYDVDDATELLLTRLGSQVRAVGETEEGKIECIEIVKELGYLPLAIEQAAAYIREVSKDLFQFLPSYKRDRRKLNSRTSIANEAFYEETVATTWHLSFQRVEEIDSDAVKLLRLLAFLNPDGILIEFLKAGAEGLSDDLKMVVSDKLYEALSELERFSLIGRQCDSALGQKVTIHRLVQSIIKDEMSADLFLNMEVQLIGLCDAAFPRWHNWQPESLQQSRRYQDQVVVPLCSVRGIKSKELSRILERVGVCLREDGKYQQARELLTKAVDIMNETGGRDNLNMFTAMAHLASTLRNQGKWEDAAKLEEEVMEARIRLLGKEHPDTLTAMANLASTLRNQGKWEDAAKLEEEVMEARIRLLGKEHPDTLTAMANLASTLRNQGKWEDAAKLEEEVMEARIRLLGKEHPDTLTAMGNLASTLRNQGKWEDAAKLEEEVMEARIRLLGKEHPDTLTAMANLASTLRNQGKWEDAAKLEEEVMEARIRLLGKEEQIGRHTAGRRIHLTTKTLF